MSDQTRSRISAQLKAFYELRAAEEPARDPEALLRFRKALTAAQLISGERLLDLGAKCGGLATTIEATGITVDYTGGFCRKPTTPQASDSTTQDNNPSTWSRQPHP